MKSDLLNDFTRDGYVVIDQLFDDEHCAALFQRVLAALDEPERTGIHENLCRTHCPLKLDDITRQATRMIIDRIGLILDEVLPRERFLVELSSITSFPGAAEQPVHPDETDPDRQIVSCFVNLMPATEEVGALQVFPGTHCSDNNIDSPAEPLIMALAAGSVVVMNSKLHHAGGANRTIDRIRPVFYVSFGDSDIEGPAYSIRDEYWRQHTIDSIRQIA